MRTDKQHPRPEPSVYVLGAVQGRRGAGAGANVAHGSVVGQGTATCPGFTYPATYPSTHLLSGIQVYLLDDEIM